MSRCVLCDYSNDTPPSDFQVGLQDPDSGQSRYFEWDDKANGYVCSHCMEAIRAIQYDAEEE